jgi:polyphenol oxidase
MISSTSDFGHRLAASSLDWILPDWPAPANVAAVMTTRHGGVSRAPYATMNLGAHVGDDEQAVAVNRQLLVDISHTQPVWLKQAHGTRVVEASIDAINAEADACVSRMPGFAPIVQVADCLPVLFADRAGTVVAAAHAGWRGLLAGVLEATMAAMDVPPRELVAWLGPAIGPRVFEVGDEVRAAFCARDAQAASGFVPGERGKWFADLYALARRRLERAGVVSVFGGGYCTYTERERFYSFRREHDTGRMAAMVWLNWA